MLLQPLLLLPYWTLLPPCARLVYCIPEDGTVEPDVMHDVHDESWVSSCLTGYI
jgi:hypothetical protein